MKIAVKVDTLKNNEIIKNLIKSFNGTLVLFTNDDRYVNTSEETKLLAQEFNLRSEQIVFMAGNSPIKYLKPLEIDVYITKSSNEVRDCNYADIKTMLIS